MRKMAAEFAGTFLLVLVGTGSIAVNEYTGGKVTHAGISATFGIIVTAMIYLFGSTSGAHINPAVTLALAAAKKFPAREIFSYITVQLGGAFAASVVLWFLFPASENLGSTLPSGEAWVSLVLEFGLTFVLMLTVFICAFGAPVLQKLTGVIVGVVVGLEAWFAGPYCGASMNPARSIAPAVVSGQTQHLWLYIVAPVLGALLAALFYQFFIGKRPNTP